MPVVVLSFVMMMADVEMPSGTDGVYGLVPQRVIDEEDEKLRAWKQDTDLVSVNSDVSLLVTGDQMIAVLYHTIE